jgi:hypothetical protein
MNYKGFNGSWAAWKRELSLHFLGSTVALHFIYGLLIDVVSS